MLNPFRSEPLQLESPYSPAECTARLLQAIDAEGSLGVSWKTMFGSKQVVGHVTQGFLSLRRRINYRNSFQLFLPANLIAQAKGTSLRGSFGMHPVAAAFMCVWLGGVSLFLFVGIVMTLQNLVAEQGKVDVSLIFILVPGVMLLFGFGLVSFGKELSRGDVVFLTNFLKTTLDAKESADADVYEPPIYEQHKL